MAYLPQLKIAGLLATAVAHHFAITPPIPPPSEEEKVCSGGAKIFENVLPWLRFGTTWTVIASILSEIVVIAKLAYPSNVPVSPEIYHTLCPSASPDTVGLQSITTTFALGVILALCGSAIRTWCYSVLGRFFTYEVSLRPAHALIRDAPYNVVRHPSYTGLFLHFVGVAVVHFSPGGWSRECGMLHTKAGFFICLWLTLVAYTFVSVWRRGAVEDNLLKSKFGSIWEQYAREVPWKFFPWIA
ncbi:hypothetical protein BC629DRAFT_1437382 [Irpex lacteus]|nr:hypothetical protein BC629DRAFT_1437382 [Irpex lacteus]